MKKLNIGCGKDIKIGYVNLDSVELKGVDIVWDLNKFPYPFQDSEFSEVLAYRILEHFNKINPVMEEIHRISKPNAIIKIITPFYNSENAHHPEHKSFFSLVSFNGWTKGDYCNYYIGKEHSFFIEDITLTGIKIPQFLLKKLSKYIPNIATEIKYTLRVFK